MLRYAPLRTALRYAVITSSKRHPDDKVVLCRLGGVPGQAQTDGCWVVLKKSDAVVSVNTDPDLQTWIDRDAVLALAPEYAHSTSRGTVLLHGGELLLVTFKLEALPRFPGVYAICYLPGGGGGVAAVQALVGEQRGMSLIPHTLLGRSDDDAAADDSVSETTGYGGAGSLFRRLSVTLRVSETKLPGMVVKAPPPLPLLASQQQKGSQQGQKQQELPLGPETASAATLQFLQQLCRAGIHSPASSASRTPAAGAAALPMPWVAWGDPVAIVCPRVTITPSTTSKHIRSAVQVGVKGLAVPRGTPPDGADCIALAPFDAPWKGLPLAHPISVVGAYLPSAALPLVTLADKMAPPLPGRWQASLLAPLRNKSDFLDKSGEEREADLRQRLVLVALKGGYRDTAVAGAREDENDEDEEEERLHAAAGSQAGLQLRATYRVCGIDDEKAEIGCSVDEAYVVRAPSVTQAYEAGGARLRVTCETTLEHSAEFGLDELRFVKPNADPLQDTETRGIVAVVPDLRSRPAATATTAAPETGVSFTAAGMIEAVFEQGVAGKPNRLPRAGEYQLCYVARPKLTATGIGTLRPKTVTMFDLFASLPGVETCTNADRSMRGFVLSRSETFHVLGAGEAPRAGPAHRIEAVLPAAAPAGRQESFDYADCDA